eukprot:363520-Chlamydomonas_euryale.AAC.6
MQGQCTLPAASLLQTSRPPTGGPVVGQSMHRRPCPASPAGCFLACMHACMAYCAAQALSCAPSDLAHAPWQERVAFRFSCQQFRAARFNSSRDFVHWEPACKCEGRGAVTIEQCQGTLPPVARQWLMRSACRRYLLFIHQLLLQQGNLQLDLALAVVVEDFGVGLLVLRLVVLRPFEIAAAGSTRSQVELIRLNMAAGAGAARRQDADAVVHDVLGCPDGTAAVLRRRSNTVNGHSDRKPSARTTHAT